MSDKDIIDIYTNKIIHNWKEIPQEHIDYLNNRFNDSESIKESVWRILYNIEKRPICPICGKHLKFYGKPKLIFAKTCSPKCGAIYSQDIRESTCNKHYGVKYPIQNNNIKEKITNTLLEKYNVDNAFKLEKIKETRKQKYGVDYLLQSKEIRNKIQNTFKEKYGYITPAKNDNVKEKRINTCNKKYGGNPGYLAGTPESLNKQIATKRKNNSFNISKPEIKSYELLREKYPDIITQYKSDLYPYYCDFYIPSLDLYIECNYHWTHGKHPYNENNINDINKVNELKSKNTKFYNNAIITWTIRDVNKRNIAKENKLNYIEFWNINELINWINQ